MISQKSIRLSTFLTLKNISGASGLIYKDKHILLISDDSNVLYAISTKTNEIHKIKLGINTNFEENIIKAEKSDFEAITAYQNKYYIIGSGSAPGRSKAIELDAENLETINEFSLQTLYSEMMKVAKVLPEDFNIEGFVLKNKKAYFFNRGNGPHKKNGIFEVENWNEPLHKITFHPITLPILNDKEFTFSDAILIENDFYFLATSENTDSVYDDGEILGSAIGILSLENLELKDFTFLTADYKLEGICLYRQSSTGIDFLLCEDADDSGWETKVFLLEMKHEY